LILTRANGVRFQNAIYGGNLNGDKIEFGRRPEKLSIGQFVEFTAQWIAIRRKRLVGHETDSVFSRYNIVHKADLEEAARKLDRQQKLGIWKAENAVRRVLDSSK